MKLKHITSIEILCLFYSLLRRIFEKYVQNSEIFDRL